MAGRDWQTWIDKAIREAQEKGLFDNLEGKGRPINWEDESLVDEEWMMAFRIMRQHGFAPEWIELHKEIGAELAKARRAVTGAWQRHQARLAQASTTERRYLEAEWQRARTAFAETLAELNVKIREFNLKVPIANLQKFRLDLGEELSGIGIEE